MKKVLIPFSLIAIVVSVIFSGCETITCYTVGGSITHENVGIAGYKRVELYTSANVVITQGDTLWAELEGNDDLSRVVQFHYDLADSTMQIDVTEDCVDGIDRFQVNCFMMDINGLENNGSGLMHVMGPVDIENIALKLTGSGNVTIDDMRTTGINATLTGSGSLSAVGPDTCFASNIQVNGSGSLYSFGLKTHNANVVLAGSGNVQVHVADTLTGTLSGSGNLSYKGNPFIDVNVTGSGQLVDAN